MKQIFKSSVIIGILFIFCGLIQLAPAQAEEQNNLKAPALDSFFNDGSNNESHEGELYDLINNENTTTQKLLDYTGAISDEDSTVGQEGASVVRSIIKKIVDVITLVMIPIGVALIVWGGLQLFLKRADEEEFAKRTRQIIWTGIGFLLIFLAVRLVDFIIFGRDGEIITGSEEAIIGAAQIARIEFIGIYNFITTFAVAVATAYVVLAGFRLIIFAYSDEERSRSIKAIMYVVLGIVVLLLAQMIVNIFFGENYVNDGVQLRSENIILFLADIVNVILGFIAIGAVIAIIIAGIMMIFGFGDDERVNKAKSTIIYAIVALVIAFSMWTIISFLIFSFV